MEALLESLQPLERPTSGRPAQLKVVLVERISSESLKVQSSLEPLERPSREALQQERPCVEALQELSLEPRPSREAPKVLEQRPSRQSLQEEVSLEPLERPESCSLPSLTPLGTRSLMASRIHVLRCASSEHAPAHP